jgi:hypothetical protein
MNRKNLTAAVLAGLAGAAGLAGTAQAVNLNPDGLGQVLIYPYYTANDGNQTILSVVNTTDNAKAVKVRFLEGFNSREVLDFNLYLSAHDVWVAAIANGEPAPDYPGTDYDTDTILIIPDDSCTVPYLYEDYQVDIDGVGLAGIQPFLDYAYTGKLNDGGPEEGQRAAEGHFEMIEMGTVTPGSDTEADITHTWHTPKDGDKYWAPGDCDQLVENWTKGATSASNGIWYAESLEDASGDDCKVGELNKNGCGQAWTDTQRNSGGLFGGAAVVHPSNGAMFSYDAKAVQGFDQTNDGIHFVPGNSSPSLNDGSETDAWVFFGVPQNKAVNLQYPFSVDAVSAVFMHEFTMNEYTTADTPAEAATEWVLTFPTKNFYVDDLIVEEQDSTWQPTTGVASCNNWKPGFTYPTTKALNTDIPIDGPGPWPGNPGWEECLYVEVFFDVDATEARPPFTEIYNGGACEPVGLLTYDRDERTYFDTPNGRPPVVSPAPPPGVPDDVVFELCNEVNVLRFGEREIFGTPSFGEGEDAQSLLVTVNDEFTDGWGWVDYYADKDHIDSVGLVGLPVTGFAAWQFENGFVENDEGDDVKAFYGGLFWHKANVRKVALKRESSVQ